MYVYIDLLFEKYVLIMFYECLNIFYECFKVRNWLLLIICEGDD